jgi:hypothetical protein
VRSELGREATYRCSRCRHVFDAVAEEPAVESEEEVEVERAREPRFALGEEGPADDDEDEDTESDAESEPAVGADGGRGRRTPARFAVRALVAVTLGYALLSIYFYTHPEAARQFFREVPLIGSRLVETRLSTGQIRLGDLRGEYRRVLGDQLVFVIQGTAINGSPVRVRGIQVEGRVKGAQELRQVVFCGAAPQDVHSLSLRELALLQTLEPPKEWTLAPGEQARFLVVFASPPADLQEFSAEVVAVQAPARAIEERRAALAR